MLEKAMPPASPLALIGARVLTMDPGRAEAEVLVVSDGRVAAVGAGLDGGAG
ncbi:MAG: hypothetical protein ACRDZ3_07530 [Acidimicrobiia bacterium]